MTNRSQADRVTGILQVMEEVKKSHLSVNLYFTEKDTPFGQVQYYLYKKALRERGIGGLYDKRSKGNHIKFTNEMKHFVKGLLEYNRPMTSLEVQNAIKTNLGLPSPTQRLITFARRTI